MGHSSVRIKVRRRKVANLAARSRQFTVHNSTIPKSDKKYYRVPWDTWLDKMPKYSWAKVAGKLFEIDSKGKFHLAETPEYTNTKHPQPKSLHKKYKKKYYVRRSRSLFESILHPLESPVYGLRKTVLHLSTFPTHTVKKMNRTEYMEALVQHKLAKWERKNPKPADMFTEDVEKWNQLRTTAEERFRDFVVSIYDKLPLIGRFKIEKETTAAYQEEKIAELKDIDGDGHKVNELKEDSKLLKQAKKTVNKVKAKRQNLVAGNLKDHKRTKGRIILPDSELRKAA